MRASGDSHEVLQSQCPASVVLHSLGIVHIMFVSLFVVWGSEFHARQNRLVASLVRVMSLD